MDRMSVETSAPSPTVQCPRCGGTQITAQKAGFGVGKAVVGAALVGGLGLLAGGIGAGKITVTCLACGQEWRPGRENEVVSPGLPEQLRQALWVVALMGALGVLVLLYWGVTSLATWLAS